MRTYHRAERISPSYDPGGPITLREYASALKIYRDYVGDPHTKAAFLDMAGEWRIGCKWYSMHLADSRYDPRIKAIIVSRYYDDKTDNERELPIMLCIDCGPFVLVDILNILETHGSNCSLEAHRKVDDSVINFIECCKCIEPQISGTHVNRTVVCIDVRSYTKGRAKLTKGGGYGGDKGAGTKRGTEKAI